MNGKNIILISFIECIIFSVLISLPVWAFVTQGTGKWGKELHEATKQGSVYFLIGTSSAINIFSAIEQNNIPQAISYKKNAIINWESAMDYFKKANNYEAALKKADPWVKQNAPNVIRIRNMSPEYGIGKEIMNNINSDGAKGLILLTIRSIELQTKQISSTVEKIELKKPPSYDRLLEQLRFITIELYKGIAISEVLYNHENFEDLDQKIGDGY